MMSDRDNVMQVQKMNVDGGLFVALGTVEHPDCPPVKKVIRMYNHDISFLKQEGPNVKMTDI